MSNNIAETARPLAKGVFKISEEDGQIRLVISRCRACGAESFPARNVRCAACSSPELAQAETPTAGTLYSWTVAPRGGVPDSSQPLVVGMVNLASGLSVQGIMAEEPEGLSIDAKVTGCVVEHGTDDDGATLIGYAFRLATDEEATS